MLKLSYWFIAVWAASCALSPSEGMDLCTVSNAASLPVVPVSVNARMGFTLHGMFLLTDQCKRKVPAAVVVNPGDPDAPPVAFQLDGEVFQRLKPFLRLTGGADIACGRIEGQFFKKKGFHLKKGSEPHGNGFGPRGALEVMFVLRSIDEIHGCP
jgi:hypothetical protein